MICNLLYVKGFEAIKSIKLLNWFDFNWFANLQPPSSNRGPSSWGLVYRQVVQFVIWVGSTFTLQNSFLEETVVIGAEQTEFAGRYLVGTSFLVSVPANWQKVVSAKIYVACPAV